MVARRILWGLAAQLAMSGLAAAQPVPDRALGDPAARPATPGASLIPPGLTPTTPAPPAFRAKEGLLIGFSAGPAVAAHRATPEVCDCIEEHGGGGLEVHLGFMPTRRFALLIELGHDIQRMRKNVDFLSHTTFEQTVVTFRARRWLARRFWIEGGAGYAHAYVPPDYCSHTVDNPSSDPPCENIFDTSVISLRTASGFEVLSREQFSIALRAELASSVFGGIRSESASISLAADFFGNH